MVGTIFASAYCRYARREVKGLSYPNYQMRCPLRQSRGGEDAKREEGGGRLQGGIAPPFSAAGLSARGPGPWGRCRACGGGRPCDGTRSAQRERRKKDPPASRRDTGAGRDERGPLARRSGQSQPVDRIRGNPKRLPARDGAAALHRTERGEAVLVLAVADLAPHLPLLPTYLASTLTSLLRSHRLNTPWWLRPLMGDQHVRRRIAKLGDFEAREHITARWTVQDPHAQFQSL